MNQPSNRLGRTREMVWACITTVKVVCPMAANTDLPQTTQGGRPNRSCLRRVNYAARQIQG